MKITHLKKVNASSEIKFAKIPTPFDKYYRLMSDEEFEDEYMYPAHPSPIEEVQDYTGAYDVKPLWYVVARPEYADVLSDSGLDCLELVREGDTDFLAYTINDRIYRLDESEISRALGSAWNDDDDDDEDPWEDDDEDGKDWYDEIDSCNQIQGAVDTGLEYWYLSKHGMGPGTIPRDVTVLDWVDDNWDTYILLDKMLTTSELNEYELKEATPPVGLETHNGVIIGSCSNVTASECTKVSENDDMIEYVVTSTDVEGMSLVNYKGYKIRSNPQVGGYDIVDPDGGLYKSGLLTERVARQCIDEIEGCSYIHGSDDMEEESEDDEFDNAPEQEYSSAGTAINGKQGKLPAVFKKAVIPNGALVLDYGGGTVESSEVAQAYLDQFDATELLYDPFNQTPEHNREVIQTLRQAGGADVAICSNVLNVIKEPEVRYDVISKIFKLMKPGATAFISVYEGSGNREGAATQNGKSYQNNSKLADYLLEVQEVFPEATRKGSVIIAQKTSTSSINSSTYVNRDDIDIEKLHDELDALRKEFMTDYERGFTLEEADEYSFLEIEDNPEFIKIEIRAELPFDSMFEFAAEADKIVERYYPDAYFDMDEPGIMSCYIPLEFDPDNDVDLAPIESSTDYFKDDEPFDTTFDFEFTAQVEEDGDWISVDNAEFNDADELISMDEDTILIASEFFHDLVAWHIPTEPGQYVVKGNATLSLFPIQDPTTSYNRIIYDIDPSGCKINDISVTRLSNIHSSTQITASMTEEDLDKAIQEGKPFDLASFKKYKVDNSKDMIMPSDIEIGDVVSIDADASEVNLGTVVKILAINDKGSKDYNNLFDYNFTVEVVEDPGKQYLKVGDVIGLHFDKDEEVGTLIPV